MPRESQDLFRRVALVPGWLNGGSAQSGMVAKGSRSVEPLLVPGRRTRPESTALVSRPQTVVLAELVTEG